MMNLLENQGPSLPDDKYVIVRPIGRGGMSRVYEAIDTRLNKSWAVKIIEKADYISASSIISEARIMKRLDHPAFPRIVDILEDENHIFIVMDYIEGTSLDQVVAKEGPQKQEDVLRWGIQICEAMIYLHNMDPPIIFRDMKPSNLILKPDGNVKIVDLGIARELDEQDTRPLGTGGYAAPEQYDGENVDARADVYGLGMTMHNLVTAKDPRRRGYVYMSADKLNSNISKGFSWIIDKCTERERRNRYKSCNDLMRDLKNPESVEAALIVRRWRLFRILIAIVVASVILFSGAVIQHYMSISEKIKDYENLTSVNQAAPTEEKNENYKAAIELFPDNPEGYQYMIDAYLEDGIFSRDESQEFISIYNSNKDHLQKDPIGFADLNYYIGIMYFTFYQNEDTSEMMERVQKAYPFFEAVKETQNLPEDYSYRNLAECYYQICYFYKRFVFYSIEMEEATPEDYRELVNVVAQAVNDISSEKPYEQLILYKGIFDLIYDRHAKFPEAGIEREALLNLIDNIYGKTELLQVSKDESINLKESIEAQYENLRGEIQAVYDIRTE